MKMYRSDFDTWVDYGMLQLLEITLIQSWGVD